MDVSSSRQEAETELQVGFPVPSALPSRRTPYLHVLTGAAAGQLFPLAGTEVVLGRGEGADVRLADTSVSRRHARLVLGSGRTARLFDEGSRNGTYAGGERVTAAPLGDGTLFNLAGVVVIKLGWYDDEEVTLLSRLYSASIRDGESGLLNRGHFIERGRAVMAQCRRQQKRVFVALVSPVEKVGTDRLRDLAAKIAESRDLVACWDEQQLVLLHEGSRDTLEGLLRQAPFPVRCGAAIVGEEVASVEEAVRAAAQAQGELGLSWAQEIVEQPLHAERLAWSQAEAVLGVRCFGPLTASRRGEPIPEGAFKTQRVRWLLGHLLASRPGGVTQDELIDCYWPEAGPSGHRSLNTALSTLRKALGQDGERPIVRETIFVRINPEYPLWDDVSALEACVREAAVHRREGRREALTASLEQAADLYRGPFLEGCFADWALARREHYQRLALDVLVELASIHLDTGEARPALDHALRAVSLEPFHQEAHLLVMQAHRRLGRPDRAVLHFEKCRRSLRDELQIEPSIPLVEECLRARLGLGPGTI